MPTTPSKQPSLTVRIGLRLLTSILGLIVAQLIFSLTVGLAVVVPVPAVILPLGVIVGVVTGFLTNRRVYRAVPDNYDEDGLDWEDMHEAGPDQDALPSGADIPDRQGHGRPARTDQRPVPAHRP